MSDHPIRSKQRERGTAEQEGRGNSIVKFANRANVSEKIRDYFVGVFLVNTLTFVVELLL